MKLKSREWVPYAAMVLCAGLVLWVLIAITRQSDRVDALADALAVEQQAARDRGEQPAAPSVDEILRDPSLRGPQGPAGRGVVSVSCPAGTWVVKYTDGTQDYLGVPCTGEPGGVGPSGDPGSDGRDGVDGATGPVGPTGATGADGRGVTVTCEPPAVDGTWRWHVAYTDGTTVADAGPCYRPGPLG